MFADALPLARRFALPTILLVAIAVVGATLGGTLTFVAVSIPVEALLILSAGLLFGQLNLLTLCPCSFAGIGVYATLWVAQRMDLPFLLGCLVGMVAAAPLGLLVGALAMRVRGENLAVLTFLFAIAVSALLNAYGMPGQADGTTPYLQAPAGFRDSRSYFLLALGILVVAGLLIAAYTNTARGRAWRVAKHSERAASALGRSVPAIKLEAFVISAALAGLSGVLLAYQDNGSVSSSSFDPITSITTVALAVMLAADSLSGAVFGGILVAFIPEILRRMGIDIGWSTVAFGLGAVTALMGGRRGAAATFIWRVRKASSRPAPDFEADPDPAAGSARAALELRAEDLCVRYGAVVALDHVTLRVPVGTVSALIGPNGAGKSTLVDVLTGFVNRYQGTTYLGERRIDRFSATRRARHGIRRTFQQGRAPEDLTISEYVSSASGRRMKREDIDRLLGFYGLPAGDMPIRFVDVGTRRIVEIAAAVAARPSILLLDEPAAGLSEEQSRQLGDRIRETPARFDCSVLLIEHDVEMVRSVATHVTVLDFGKVLAEGAPAIVLADPAVIAAYLGEDSDEPSSDPLPPPSAPGGAAFVDKPSHV